MAHNTKRVLFHKHRASVSDDATGKTVDKAVQNIFGIKAQLSVASSGFFVQCQQGVFMKLF